MTLHSHLGGARISVLERVASFCTGRGHGDGAAHAQGPDRRPVGAARSCLCAGRGLCLCQAKACHPGGRRWYVALGAGGLGTNQGVELRRLLVNSGREMSRSKSAGCPQICGPVDKRTSCVRAAHCGTLLSTSCSQQMGLLCSGLARSSPPSQPPPQATSATRLCENRRSSRTWRSGTATFGLWSPRWPFPVRGRLRERALLSAVSYLVAD